MSRAVRPRARSSATATRISSRPRGACATARSSRSARSISNPSSIECRTKAGTKNRIRVKSLSLDDLGLLLAGDIPHVRASEANPKNFRFGLDFARNHLARGQSPCRGYGVRTLWAPHSSSTFRVPLTLRTGPGLSVDPRRLRSPSGSRLVSFRSPRWLISSERFKLKCHVDVTMCHGLSTTLACAPLRFVGRSSPSNFLSLRRKPFTMRVNSPQRFM
jgi:hypothetical protein